MINLRYHIVSLTAVFLALGLGILAGTTVIDQQVVRGLEGNTRALENDLNDKQRQIDALESQLQVFDGFSDAVVPGLLQGKLSGSPVVLLTDRRVPDDTVQLVSETLILAGAKRATRLAFSDRWALDQPATTRQLATVLGSTDTEREALIAEAASRLATRLATSNDPRADGDLIRALENSGFIDVADLPATGLFPASNAIVVVVTSGAEDSTPDEDEFFVPLLRKLSANRVIAAAEPLNAQRSFAEKIRGDRALSHVIGTIDHVDTAAGRLSLVFALRDLLRGRPAEHFGVREGAASVAPDVGAA